MTTWGRWVLKLCDAYFPPRHISRCRLEVYSAASGRRVHAVVSLTGLSCVRVVFMQTKKP